MKHDSTTTPVHRTVAIIPARGGSKGIPLKNLQKVAGVSLLARAVHAARATPSIDRVIVSTDHPDIAAEAVRAGAEVSHRPADLAGDSATSESALIHTLGGLDEWFDTTVFLQCTSPFIDSASIDSAVRRVASGGADVVFSAVEDHSFLWRLDDDGHAVAVGHEASFRPRRQDRAKHFNETGAFYVMRTDGLLEHGHRFFGRIAIEEVPAEHAREIDDMSDLTLVRALASTQETAEIIDVDALVTDFDGVHTDDGAYVDEDGNEQVRVHRGDGMGVSRLVRAGVPVMILSKERNPVVTRRAEKLHVDVTQGVDDKARVLRAWIEGNGLDPARVAYVGNDINDLEAFDVVGWPIAVADAHPKVRAAARVVLDRSGGRGAVREVCDLIPLRAEVHEPVSQEAAADSPVPVPAAQPVGGREAPAESQGADPSTIHRQPALLHARS
ncbi:N-acylneuraminate cytidylyltransferase [Brevibacterium sanguinis]|uniref:N-acylneuraminate cytidylyltransferase n=2 Tax=Brevibacterium TaxID=1696 RepID=A0A366IPR2_9MICO|nr:MULTISPECIES: acylneuraminate cytidylyltransferase [Brevibacterium]RBP68232.1 N-acylneuraminate cytidylyltransferase [Brevibacterium sanguinis]RBP74351.1 N-acylneuraminate cytidylyltransferase [Brevibacterium celere]